MSHPDGESLLKWFLDHGAPVNGLPSNPGAPLRDAPNATIASHLLDHGAVVKYTSALHSAIFFENDADALPLMSLLLDHGIDIDELEYEGRDKLPREAAHSDHATALYVAAQEGSVERAKLLVERGADLGKKSKNGYTARDHAQLERQEDVKAYLEDMMRQRGMEVKELEEEEEEVDGYNDDYARRDARIADRLNDKGITTSV